MHPFLRFALVCVLGLFAVGSAHAQYRVYHWSSFEDARLPADYSPIGKQFDQMAQIVDLTATTDGPAAFRDPKTAHETGRYALSIRSDPAVLVTGFGTGVMLYRSRLGARGKALFQADFFVPDDSQPMTNMAVLAMEPMKEGRNKPRSFYRFGVAPVGSKARRYVYFSHMDGQESKVWVRDTEMYNALSKPAWHRFSILFEGQRTVRCYIDGVETSFSPMTETELQTMQVGIMVADNDSTTVSWVDNLSIQWAMQDHPLPDVVYARSWAPGAGGGDGLPPGGRSWFTPQAGRLESNRRQTPMLVYLHSPEVAATKELNNLFATSTSARTFLDSHIPIEVDVNQLYGGSVAERLGVYRVPTLIVMNPDGSEAGRTTFVEGNSWSDILGGLQ